MRGWGGGIMEWGGVLVAALLLPGGFLLLAWALYRWWSRRLAARGPLL